MSEIYFFRTNGVLIVGLAGRGTKFYEAVGECGDTRYKMIQDNQTIPFRHAASQQVNFPTTGCLK